MSPMCNPMGRQVRVRVWQSKQGRGKWHSRWKHTAGVNQAAAAGCHNEGESEGRGRHRGRGRGQGWGEQGDKLPVTGERSASPAKPSCRVRPRLLLLL